MADVGDQNNSNDAPTAPFRKIVPPEDETVVFPRIPPAGAPDDDSEAGETKPSGLRPGHVKPGGVGSGAVPPLRVGTGPVPPGGFSGGAPYRPADTPPRPGPPPPPRGGLLSRIGDIPIRVVYLAGAIVATVIAVLLVFLIFSGDVPTQTEGEQVEVVPVPTVSGAPAPGTPATGFERI